MPQIKEYFVVENGRYYEVHTYEYDENGRRWEKTVSDTGLTQNDAIVCCRLWRTVD